MIWPSSSQPSDKSHQMGLSRLLSSMSGLQSRTKARGKLIDRSTLPPYQPYTREGRGSFDNSFSEYKDNHPSQSPPSSLSFHGPPTGHRSDPSFHLADHVTCSENAYLNSNRPRSTSSIGYGGSDYEVRIRSSPDQPSWKEESPSRIGPASNPGVRPSPSSNGTKAGGNFSSQRKPFNRDEFDGQVQYLSKPPPEVFAAQEQDLPQLPTNLLSNEQDDILSQVNDCLSQCAYDFVAKYEFPIPVEPDKRQVRAPVDRGMRPLLQPSTAAC